MFCSFNTGDNQKVYKAFTTALTAIMNKIASDPTAKFDVKEIMKMIYERTMERTSDHEQAVNNARMVPNIISMIANRDKASAAPLLSKGLDIGGLFTLSMAVEAEADGMDKTIEALGISADVLQEGKDAAEGDSTEDEPEDLPEPNLNGANPPSGQLTFSFDDEGEVEVEEVEVEEEPQENEEGEIIVPTKKTLEAVAPHALKDTDQEALSMDPRDPRYNVIDPAKKFFYTVKRALVRLFRGELAGDAQLPGVGKIYLKAQSAETLPADMKLGTTTPVVMIVVNEKGQAVKFDDNGKVSDSGRIAFYNLRNPYDENGEYEKMRVQALSRMLNISMAAAQEKMSSERDIVNKVLEYVGKDINNTVLMNITGGTLGYLANQKDSYPISKIAFGTSTFNPVVGEDGNYYFSIPSVSDQRIKIEQTPFKDSAEMVDLIANLLVDDVYDRAGVKYSNSEKRALVERYLLLNTNRLTIINAGPKLFGQFLDVSTPEAKEKAKQAIRDFFNNVTPYQVVTADEARARLAKNKGKIVTDFKGATPNDILQSTDETTGEPIFRTLVNTVMNITQAGMQNGNHFSLTPRAEGGMTIAMIPGGYVEQYIKNNFKLNKLLNGQNELVALNAYLTFSPVAFETGKLDLEQEVKDEEELSKDAEKAGIDTKEQTPEQIEADVVIELATLQANNKAKNKGKKATKVEILNEIKTRFDINIMTADYTFEFAQQVLDAIKEKYKLSAVQYKAFQEIINNYLRPTAAPASSTPVVLSIEEIRAELQAKYDRAMANATRSQDLPIIAKAKQRLDEYNAKHPKPSDQSPNAEFEAKKAEIEKRREEELTELGQKQLTKGFNSLSEATKPEQVANAIVNIEQNKNQGARLSKEQEQQLSEAKAKLKEQGYEIVDYNIVRYGENTIVESIDFYNSEKDILTEEQANAIESKINNLEKRGEEVNVDDLPSPVSRTIKPLIKKDGVMVQAAKVNTLIFESVEQAREAIKKSREAGNKKPNAADKINAKYDAELSKAKLAFLDSMNAQLAAAVANVVMPNQNVELDNPTEQKVDPPSASDKKRQRTSRKANTSRITQAKKDDENKTDNRGFGQQLSDDEWNKTVVQRSNGTITEKQLQEAKAWYENHPMSKLVPFREMFDAVNSQDRNSIATFSRNGIVLYKGSNLTDLYHEAWHAFTQAFMTPEQRKEIYDEIRGKKGTFRDETGKLVAFEVASDTQIEEYLAEEFRKYMLRGGKSTKAVKAEPKTTRFFDKIAQILEFLFGDLTMQDIALGDRANSKMDTLFENLRMGKMDGYTYDAANISSPVYNKTAVQATQENESRINLTSKESKLMLDSMDSWIAQVVDAANVGLTDKDQYDKFIKKQVNLFLAKTSPQQMEKIKLKDSPKLTYSQSVLFLKTKAGRELAYKNVFWILADLEIEMRKEREKAIKKKDTAKIDEINRKLSLIMWSRDNFGDLTNIENNKPSNDGTVKGLIGYHMQRSTDFSEKVIELIDAAEVPDEQKTSRSEYSDKSGNEVSTKEMAKKEVLYLFKTLFRVDPKTNEFITNELGAPERMDFALVWNKVTQILENELDATNMYKKLMEYAQQEEQTELTHAVRQLLGKLGPLGLSKKNFPHLYNPHVVDLWSNFWSVFSTRRIPLIAQEISIEKDDKGRKTGNVESRIGRGINPYARVGSAWNSQFKMSNILEDKNPFVDYIDGIPRLSIPRLINHFKSYENIMANDMQYEFLDAIGIKMTRNQQVDKALREGDKEINMPGEFHIIKTLMMRSGFRVTNDSLFKKTNAELPTFARSTRDNTSYLSLLEMFDANDIWISQPEDLFNLDRKGNFIGAYQNVKDTQTGETTKKPVYISEIEGEGTNWNNIRAVEGQYGDGVVSYMVTTASGTTQFEQSLNSSMSIIITSMNSAKDYQDLIKMPHMAQFDISKNPGARNHAWLKNMFKIGREWEGTAEYGQRKSVKGVEVRLVLSNLSGFKTNEADGVASASADPYTKFIGDMHLATQTGNYELMRHSDKNTSYMVGLNYVMDPNGIGKPMAGMYIRNIDFLMPRDEYGARAFMNYILPNLSNEHARIQRLKAKKEEINRAIEQRRMEIASGQTENLTVVPAYDYEYLKNGQKFLAFQGVYNKALKDELLTVTGDLIDALELPEYADLKARLIAETNEYFKKRYEEAKHFYKKAGFVATNLDKTVKEQHREEYGKGDPSYVGPTSSQVEDALINAYVYNSWIHNIESMNGLYGDIALYNHAKEAFHKRNAGIASTGTGYRVDSAMLDYVNNTLGRGFEEQFHGKSIRTYDGTMNTGVMKDKITRSEYLEEIAANLYKQMTEAAIKANSALPADRRKTVQEIEANIKQKLWGDPTIDMSSPEVLEGKIPEPKSIMRGYYAMNEADAQGWITMDAYRILAKSQGEWEPPQERLYQAMLNGEEVQGDEMGTFFPPLKTQYWGPLKTEGDPIYAFHKFQLTPIIPTMLKSSPKLEKLNQKMLKQGMDYVLFESGSKTGTITSVQYDAYGMPIRVDAKGKTITSRLENGALNPNYNDSLDIASIKDEIYNNEREVTDNEFTINTIHVNYLKNQLKIQPKFKGKVTIPTQIRKLITVDLMSNGIPNDFMVGAELEDRIEAWHDLTDVEQEAASANYRSIRNFERRVANLTNIKKQEILTRAKLSINSQGELVGNIENLIKYVKSQLTDQDIAEHELDFIDWNVNTGALQNDLSFSLASDKIERLLNALITKSLIKQTMKGEPLIQVSGAMLEREPQFRAATKEENLRHGSNGLKYYRLNPITGRIEPMEIKIAMQGDFEKLLYLPEVAVFENEINETGATVMHKGKPVQKLNYNASLANLNRLLKDENWLSKDQNRLFVTVHGDRIPIQGLNSDEFAQIVEFLPKEQGNIIILPAEIVAKSGGDFDIDKLTMMFPNISLNSVRNPDGSLTYTVQLYKAFTEEEYQEKYREYKTKKAQEFITRDWKTKQDKKKGLELYYAAFGKEGEDVANSQIIDILLEEAEMLSFEEFILKDQEKAAQNEFLFALNDLTSNGANYMNLVRPNGTDILDPIVDELRKLYRDYDPSFSSNDEEIEEGKIQATRIFEIGYNLDKHMRNNYGKKALGIGAIDNTYNELMNRVGMYLVPNNREVNKGQESEDIKPAVQRLNRLAELELLQEAGKVLTVEEQAELSKLKVTRSNDIKTVESFEHQTLYLPHNSMRVKDIKGNPYKDRAISFSHSMDSMGDTKIGDTINQLMNGWVDIANDPWIFYLRANEKLGPILSFLVQAGVPVRQAAYMVSQPAVVDYMETIDRLQSTFKDALPENMSKDAAEELTRNRAILKAKETMLEKFGYDLDKGGNNRVENVSKTIAIESALAIPKVLNENNEFDMNKMYEQLDYAYEKYPVFDKNTGMPKENYNIDYSDEKLSNFQRAIFLHFLQIVNMEAALKDIKLRTNFDTTQSGSLYDAQNKINQLMELKRSRMDSTNNSQTKYWRIPSEVIERLVPTIKRADGSDTGILDEAKAASMLAGFYQQPFQITMWRDLFATKNNAIIDGYLSDMDFNQREDGKTDTYFTTDEKLITEFKNSIVPIIFQNSFLSFDISQLDKTGTGKVAYYRGAEVRLNSVLSLPHWGAVARYEDVVTENGITISEPVIYYDYNTLYHQFIHKTYATPAYEEVGLAKLDPLAFNSFGEYVKYVFEREYLRAQYINTKGKSIITSLNKNAEYKESLAQITRDITRDVEGGETVAQFNRRKHRIAFERFIRNKALRNAYNMHALFNGQTSYAYTIASIKADPNNKGILEAFPVLNNIIPDNETSKAAKTEKRERVNLAFIEAPKDANTINSYYEQFQDLANEVALDRIMPMVEGESAEDRSVRLGEIADIFRKLPIVSFLQSGMNTTGRFAFGRVVDQDTITAMTKEAAEEFIQKITEEKSRNVKDTLDNYWKAFIQANKRYDARGKNFMINTNKEGKPTSNLDNRLWVGEKGRSYDPNTLTPEGTMMRKRSIKVGDPLKISFAIKGSKSEVQSTITDIFWNGKRIVVTAVNNKVDKDGVAKTYTLLYDEDANLIQQVGSTGNVVSADSVTANIVLDPSLVKQLKGGVVEPTQVGGTVEYYWVQTNGKPYPVTAEVLELEDLGYGITYGAGGVAFYLEGKERYRIKVKYTAYNTETVKHFVVDSSGKVISEIRNDGRFAKPALDEAKTKFYLEVPANRKKGQYVVTSMDDAQKAINSGIFVPGTIVDVVSATPYENVTKSTLYVYDDSSMKLVPLEETQNPVEEKDDTIRLDDTNFFAVYNGVVTPAASVYADGQSTPPTLSGKVDIKDRYMEHSGFTNKATLITRNRYSGGALNEWFTDDIDPETGKATINETNKQLIDNCLDGIQAQIDSGLIPIFSEAGYGQYMIGADDATGKLFVDAQGKPIAKPVARETFLYLSQQLMERFGYLNPNFVKQAEGQQAFVNELDQPVTDAEYMDLMNKCFS